MTIFVCSNCNNELKSGERKHCETTNTTECSECRFHLLNGTRSIQKYNEWLRK
jgi:DNA-directed RNA polymerase subunit RPC12/RpoP